MKPNEKKCQCECGCNGRDEFLESFVYSTITTYDSNEVNLYLVDFGSEGLYLLVKSGSFPT